MKKTLLALLVLSTSFAQSAEEFKITPNSLRERLLKDSTQIEIALNSLARAKENVRLARTQLLPSVNLGGILSVGSGNPSFILSSVDTLLPFLLPSNWFNLRQSKKLYKAEELGFLVLKMNLYASAESLYLTVLSDQKVLEATRAQLADFEAIENLLEVEARVLGTVPGEKLALARAQTALSRNRVAVLQTLLDQETASMRQVLGLPLNADIQFELAEVPAVEGETELNLEDAVKQALAKAPESQQLAYLVQAAKSERWKKVFGFMSTATLGALSQNNGGVPAPVSFNSLAGRGTLQVGLATIPSVRITNRNVDELKLRNEELGQELGRVLETSISALGHAHGRRSYSAAAEVEFQNAFSIARMRYGLGMGNLQDMLEIRIQSTNSAQAGAESWLALQLQRVALHRAFLSDQFKRIATP